MARGDSLFSVNIVVPFLFCTMLMHHCFSVIKNTHQTEFTSLDINVPVIPLTLNPKLTYWDEGYLIEHLLSMGEVLGLIVSPSKTKQKKSTLKLSDSSSLKQKDAGHK